MFDHRYAVPEHSDSVAMVQPMVTTSTVVEGSTPLHDQFGPLWMKARLLEPKRHRLFGKEKDVTAVRHQNGEPRLDADDRRRQDCNRHAEVLRISELCSPPVLVLDNSAPQADLSEQTVFHVTESPQVLEASAGVHAAGTFGLRPLVAARRSTFGGERLSWPPGNPVQRFHASCVPLPDSTSNDREDVIGHYRHAGCSTGSACGLCAGMSGSDSTVAGSRTSAGRGHSRGSTTISRTGLPMFMGHFACVRRARSRCRLLRITCFPSSG
jgi:hypothetical protein